MSLIDPQTFHRAESLRRAELIRHADAHRVAAHADTGQRAARSRPARATRWVPRLLRVFG